MRETNLRTGKSHIYDTEERRREVEVNQQNGIAGFFDPFFGDLENLDIITLEPYTPNGGETTKG